MPKKKKKGNKSEVADGFDDMLADFRAADVANVSSSHVARMAVDVTPSNASRAQGLEVTVPEATIFAAIKAGDVARLRRWHRQGVQFSANIVCSAAVRGSIAVMKCLVKELGADINRAAEDGFTPLMVAAHFGHVAVVQYLGREPGADINITDREGATALILAAQNGHLDVVQCLVGELGADVNQASCHGLTPIMSAAQNGHVAVVRCLGKEHGADVNKADSQGATALFLSAQREDLDAVRCLVNELGADVNKADRQGATVLVLAAQAGHLGILQCLVAELGADVNLATHDGRTALMMASLKKQDTVVRWLTRHGANVQASNKYGTAVDASKSGGAPIEQTEYLEAKVHCSNTGCSGAGIKKCTGCKQVRYCGQVCQLAHWKAHKVDCKANKKASGSQF